MIINIKVLPKSSQNKIIPLNDNNFKVKLTTAPEKGKANAKLISLLAKKFKVSISRIEILKGLTSTKKIVKINI